MTIEPLLTAQQVAKMLGVPRVGWILEQARRENDPLPSFRFGEGENRGPVRFRASEVEEWLARRSTRRVAS